MERNTSDRSAPSRGPGRIVDKARAFAHKMKEAEALKRAKAVIMTSLLGASSVVGALAPVAAYAVDPPRDFAARKITGITEDTFEDADKKWSIDFTGVELNTGSELKYQKDIRGQLAGGPYQSWLQGPGTAGTDWFYDKYGGWYFNVEQHTPGDNLSLRFTGGSYKGTPVDAIMSVTDWEVVEPAGGWSSLAPGHWNQVPHIVMSINGWKSTADRVNGQAYTDGTVDPGDDAYNFRSFNVYTIGVHSCQVTLEFVYAGTSQRYDEVEGHIASTDIDVGQKFAFSGACTEGLVADDTPLIVDYDQGVAYGRDRSSGEKLYFDTADFVDYRAGMVESYFDQSSTNEPLKFWFGTSYGDGDTPESIFFLTADYLTAPVPPEYPEDEDDPKPPVKSADKTEDVSVDDEVEFTVDVQVYREGIDCRWGYRYSYLEIVDLLPIEMKYVDGSGKLLDEDGNDITTQAGTIAFDGDDTSPDTNTVRFEFNRDYLQNMQLLGQHYKFVFKAKLIEYPAGIPDDHWAPLYVDNKAYLHVNNQAKMYSNTVRVNLKEPKFEVDKSADKYEYEVGDIITYTVKYKQVVKNAQSRWTVVSDQLPGSLELIPESVKATGIKDLPAPEIKDNGWSISFDKFNYGDELVVTYQAKVLQNANGEEVVNLGSIHSNNTPDEDDPEEIYANTANINVEKVADRYEGYVGASDQDPGFFEYTVTVTNDQPGTVANEVVITDDSLPEGMKLGRNNDGSLMITSFTENGAPVTMNKDFPSAPDQYYGVLSDIEYRVGEDEGQSRFDGDFVNDQTKTITPRWEIRPKGTGWVMQLDHLKAGQTLVIKYRAYPEDSVSGWEVENKVTGEAENSQPDEDTEIVWVNQPHFAIDKQASNTDWQVNDDILYEVKVTNTTPGTLARNVVISDLAHTAGVELLHDTIMVYDSEGRDITDSCTISFKHNPYDAETFIIQTHRDLIAGMTDDVVELYNELLETKTEEEFNAVLEKIKAAISDGAGADHDSHATTIPGRPVWRDGGIVWLDESNPLGVNQHNPRDGSLSCETEFTVCYRVKIEDPELAGQTVSNTAHVESDEPNTGTTDDEVVDVKGPKLVIQKTSDKNLYQVGETGHYTLTVMQTREDCEAKNVIIADAMTQSGIGEIVEGSIKAEGPAGTIDTSGIEYVRDEQNRIIGFTLPTNTNLRDEQVITVTYDVNFLDAVYDLRNIAEANAENAVGGVDDNIVHVVKPYTHIEMTKSVDKEMVRFMDWATYTIQAEVNDNPAENVVISDMSLPEGMQIDYDSITVKKDGQDLGHGAVEWVAPNGFKAHIGDCEPSTVITITYRAQVRDEVLKGTSVVNVAELTSDTLEEPLRDDAHITIPLDEPNVWMSKDVDDHFIDLGQTVTYTINAYVSDRSDGAKNVVIKDDSLPDAMHIDMASIRMWINGVEQVPVNADIDGNTFSVPVGDLRAGETVKITYQATAQDKVLVGRDVTNTATLTSDSLDDPLTDSETVHIGGHHDPDWPEWPEWPDWPDWPEWPWPDWPDWDPDWPDWPDWPNWNEGDLLIVKDSDRSYYTPGATGHYVLRVTNPNVKTADDVIVTDTLDAEDRDVAQIVDGTVRVFNSAGNEIHMTKAVDYVRDSTGRIYGFVANTGYDLVSTDALYVVYDVAFDADIAAAEDVENMATAKTPDGPESETEHHVTVDPESHAELTIDKSVDKRVTAPGDTLTYTLTVRELAPDSVAKDVIVTDSIPDGLTVDPVSVTVEKNGYIQNVQTEFPLNHKMRVYLGDVSYGDVWTITYKATVAADFTGDAIRNSVIAESPNIPENPEDETTTPLDEPGLTIEKVASTHQVKPGDEFDWVITVNQTMRDSVASNVVVTDQLPDGFVAENKNIVVTDSLGNPRNAPHTLVNGLMTVELGDINYNEPVVITVHGKVRDDFGGDSLKNTAVAKADNVPDPVEDSDEVLLGARLKIDKEADRDFVQAGGELNWNIVVTQVAPEAVAKNAVVTDELPEGFTASANEVTVTDAQGQDRTRSCSIKLENGVLTVGLGDLAYNDPLTITIRGHVDADFEGDSIENTAVADADNVPDPVEDTDKVSTHPELAIEKTADKRTVKVGDTFTWTVKVRQTVDGATAHNVVMSDEMPDGFEANGALIGVTDESGAAWANARVELNEDGELTVSLGDMAYGQVAVINIPGTVTADVKGNSITNVAEAVADDVPEPVRDDETVVLGETPALDIVKDADKTLVKPGDSVSYTVTTTVGNGALKSVIVSDDIPEGLTLDADSIKVYLNGGAFDTTGRLTIHDGDILVAMGDRAANDVVTLTYTCTVDSDVLTGVAIKNVATASADGVPPVRDEETVNTPTDEPPLTIEKTSDKTEVEPGQTVEYEVVTTVGKANLDDVVVTDELPAGLTLNKDSVMVYINGSVYSTTDHVTFDGQTMTVDAGDRAAGDVIRITYTAQVNDDVASGTKLTNVAEASANGVEPVRDKVTVTNTSDTPEEPKLTVDKTADKTDVEAGDTVGYTITTTANGDLTGVVVTDQLPDGMTVDEDSIKVTLNGKDFATVGKLMLEDGVLKLEVGSMKADDKLVITYDATVDDDVKGGSQLVNTAVGSADGIDPVTDTATVTVPCPEDGKPNDGEPSDGNGNGTNNGGTPTTPSGNGGNGGTGTTGTGSGSGNGYTDIPKDLGKNLGKTGDVLAQFLPAILVGMGIICLGCVAMYNREELMRRFSGRLATEGPADDIRRDFSGK